MADTVRTSTGNLAQWTLTGALKRLVPQFMRDLIVSIAAWVAPSFTTLTDGATITWDTGGYPTSHAVVTLGGNRILTLTNLVAGASGTLIIKQDATGGRTLTLPSGSTVVSGAFSLSPSANAVDVAAFVYDGTTLWWTYGKAFA